MYVCMCVYVCMNVWMYACLPVCMYVCLYVCMSVCLCVYVCVCVCMCVCVCVCECVCVFVCVSIICIIYCAYIIKLWYLIYILCIYNSILYYWYTTFISSPTGPRPAHGESLPLDSDSDHLGWAHCVAGYRWSLHGLRMSAELGLRPGPYPARRISSIARFWHQMPKMSKIPRKSRLHTCRK